MAPIVHPLLDHWRQQRISRVAAHLLIVAHTAPPRSQRWADKSFILVTSPKICGFVWTQLSICCQQGHANHQ